MTTAFRQVSMVAEAEAVSRACRHAAVPPNRPTMDVILGDLHLDMGELPADWAGEVRRTARALACAAVERALDTGHTRRSFIEVWDEDGTLLVAVTATVQVLRPGMPGRGLPSVVEPRPDTDTDADGKDARRLRLKRQAPSTGEGRRSRPPREAA